MEKERKYMRVNLRFALGENFVRENLSISARERLRKKKEGRENMRVHLSMCAEGERDWDKEIVRLQLSICEDEGYWGKRCIRERAHDRGRI